MKCDGFSSKDTRKGLLIEKARELKEAGLKWSWKPGDFFVLCWEENPETESAIRVCYKGFSGDYYGDKEDIWIPRLDQLLEEIMVRSYRIKLESFIGVFKNRDYCVTVDAGRKRKAFWSRSSLEDATADALLWLLDMETGGRP